MRGADSFNEALFSTIQFEEFVPANHPLRSIRTWLNAVLSKMDARFAAMYEADIYGGRRIIDLKKRMRAMLLKVLFSTPSKRLLIDQISYNLLFLWFVGLSIEDTVSKHSVLSKNHGRLIIFDAVTGLLNISAEMAATQGLLSGEHSASTAH